MKNSSQGFTFVEFMVVFALGAVLVSLAVPGFASLVRNNRIKSAGDALLSSLSLAHSEAIKRNAPVTVCKSSDGASCVTSGDYSQGWIVYVDDQSTPGTVETGETIIFTREPVHQTLSLAGSGAANISNFIVFGPEGTTADAGSLTICNDQAGNHGRAINVSAMGRVRILGGIECS